jgi:aryl-alcohol dehydrogenase-like predicted oxidoreductase
LNSFINGDLRQLGRTGISVSPIGLGSVKFGRNTDVKYPTTFDIPGDSALENLVSLAHELGVNLIDTAPAYGDAESKLGRILKPQRHTWVLSTKVGEQYDNGNSSHDYSSDAIRQSIESSLKNLQTDYLDIVLIHSSGEDKKILEQSDVVSELIRMRERGLIRAIGASTKTVEGGLLALKMMDLVMVAYNPDDTSQASVLDAAEKQNKGLLVKKALVSGHTQNARESLRFVLQNKAVTSAIIGTINPDHLRQNVEDARGV